MIRSFTTRVSGAIVLAALAMSPALAITVQSSSGGAGGRASLIDPDEQVEHVASQAQQAASRGVYDPGSAASVMHHGNGNGRDSGVSTPGVGLSGRPFGF